MGKQRDIGSFFSKVAKPAGAATGESKDATKENKRSVEASGAKKAEEVRWWALGGLFVCARHDVDAARCVLRAACCVLRAACCAFVCCARRDERPPFSQPPPHPHPINNGRTAAA